MQVLLQFTFKTLTHLTLIDFITSRIEFINLCGNLIEYTNKAFEFIEFCENPSFFIVKISRIYTRTLLLILKTTTKLAAQLKAFYKTGYKYTNHILLLVLKYIIQLCSKLEQPPLLLR